MKITRKTNYRVEVTPYGPGQSRWFSIGNPENDERYAEKMQRECERVASEIRRHVDDVQCVDVLYDTTDVCSHCGRDWDEQPDDSDPEFPKGMPACCDAAISEWESERKKGDPQP